MVLPTTGQISFQDIQDEFGGEHPIALDEYYSDSSSGFTTGVDGIPISGTEIGLAAFRGKEKPSVVTEKTVTLTHDNTFDAPGIQSKGTNYTSVLSPEIQLPSDFQTLIEWSLRLTGIYNNLSSKGSTGDMESFGLVYSTNGNTIETFPYYLSHYDINTPNPTFDVTETGTTLFESGTTSVKGIINIKNKPNITNAKFYLTIKYST